MNQFTKDRVVVDKRERLIDKDMEEGEEAVSASPLSSPAFWLALKVSLITGVLTALVVALVLAFMAISDVEEQLVQLTTQVDELKSRQTILANGVKQLSSENVILTGEINSLDLSAAKGDLRTALEILATQSDNHDKQLAVTRNGLISLARMVKGSRVWQDDYRAQFQELFQHNDQVKDSINQLRGTVKQDKPESRYIELDF